LNISNRKFTLPSELAVKHKVVEEEVFRSGGEAKGLKDACFEVGTRGMDELITARSHLKESGGKIVPKEVIPLFLAAVSALIRQILPYGSSFIGFSPWFGTCV
jgi:NADH dehydrogenase [ubiquinone] 1 alpha subcomplex assembly factor 6